MKSTAAWKPTGKNVMFRISGDPIKIKINERFKNMQMQLKTALKIVFPSKRESA